MIDGVLPPASVSAEQIPGIHLPPHIIQAGVIPVGDDGPRHALELGQVVHDHAAEERAAVLQGGLVDDDGGALGTDALHHALDAALPEVVAAGLHRQAVHADDGLALLRGIPAPVVLVRPGHPQHLRGDEVLPRPVALHDGAHHVLRHVGVVGQQLLGVLGEAVAAVTERGVVVVGADARVQAHPVDDGAGVQALDLGVGVQLVEVADAQGQVSVREELDGLGFLQAHEQGRDVLLQCSLLQQSCEGARRPLEVRYVRNGLQGAVLLLELGAVYHLRHSDNDPAGIEVVVQGLALAQELRGEQQVKPPHALPPVLHVQAAAVAHGDGGLDDHHRVRVDLQHEVYDLLHVRGVEVVAHGVVVGRCGNDDELRVGVGLPSVQRRHQV